MIEQHRWPRPTDDRRDERHDEDDERHDEDELTVLVVCPRCEREFVASDAEISDGSWLRHCPHCHDAGREL